MWSQIASVSSWFSLAAFVVAALVIAYRRKLARDEQFIKGARPEDFPKVLAIARQRLQVPVENLPHEEIAPLLKLEMDSSLERLRIVLRAFLSLAFLLAGVGAILYVSRPPAVSGSDNIACSQLYQRGAYDITQGYYDAAAAKFAEVTVRCPTDIGAWRDMGFAKFKLERFGEAFAAYKRAFELDPKDLDTRFNVGLLYIHLNNDNAAKGVFEELLKDEPADTPTHYHLGLANQRLGNFDQMVAHYDAVIAAAGEYSDAAAFNLAAEFAKRAENCSSVDTGEALKLLDQSVSLARKNNSDPQERMRRITGESKTENGEKLNRLRSCPGYEAVVARR